MTCWHCGKVLAETNSFVQVAGTCDCIVCGVDTNAGRKPGACQACKGRAFNERHRKVLDLFDPRDRKNWRHAIVDGHHKNIYLPTEGVITGVITVEFSDDEWAALESNAARANQKWRKAGLRSKKLDTKKSDTELNLWWYASEIAVHRVFGLPYDIKAVTERPDDGHDIVLPSGQRAQIKCPGRLGKYFTLRLPDGEIWLTVPIGILCRESYRPHGVDIIGWITRDDALRLAEEVVLGTWQTTAVHERHFRPLRDGLLSQ